MIEKLYKNIAAGLKAVKPCTVYVEDVPQGFKQPSFLIAFYEQNPTRGINGRLKNTVNVDVSYFPESKQETDEECWEIGQGLARELEVSEFKMKNRNIKITDHVLHYMFDVDYREFCASTTPTMQEMTQQTEVKED